MATSIKLKFTSSKIKGKTGVICLQLIHNRKTKFLRTRFRLFPTEWDKQKETIFFDNSDRERQIYLQSIKAGIDIELKQLDELIYTLEIKSDYTIEELTELYTNNSFNGYFFPFVDYVIKNLKNVNRKKTASICMTAQKSFQRFLCGQDILIDNIDRSFDVWQNGNWATHVDFEDFCEYILPYKCIDGQTLDNWREYSKTAYGTGLDLLHYCALYKNLAFKACEIVNLKLNKQLNPQIVLQSASLPVKRLRSAFHKPFGTCHDYGFIATAVLRAKGIPVTIDYTPQWPFRSMGHSWNVLLDNFGKNIIFVGCFSRLVLFRLPIHLY